MLLWFVFGAIFGVWNVFQSPGLDFRLVAAGALLPTLIDLPFGAQSYAHTLLPAFGTSRPDAALFPPWPVVAIEELLGLAAAWWTWTRFGLRDNARRRELVH